MYILFKYREDNYNHCLFSGFSYDGPKLSSGISFVKIQITPQIFENSIQTQDEIIMYFGET